jgi:hypothetical protein
MSIKANRNQRSMRIVPAILAALAMMAFGRTSEATAQNAGSRSFLRLCPTHVGGDREFKGHGPEVDASVTLRRAAGNEQVALDIYLHEIETTSDWSEAEYSRTQSLITAPSGRPYTQIWAPDASGAFAWTGLGNAPTYGNAIITYTDTDHALDRFFNPQWWVSEISIIGDTGGNDIGNCTTDDAYITVRLPAIWFWYN